MVFTSAEAKTMHKEEYVSIYFNSFNTNSTSASEPSSVVVIYIKHIDGSSLSNSIEAFPFKLLVNSDKSNFEPERSVCSAA